MRELSDKLGQLTVDNYLWLLDDALYIKAYLSSVSIAAVSTALALLIGFPLAYGMARAPQNMRALLLMLVISSLLDQFPYSGIRLDRAS